MIKSAYLAGPMRGYPRFNFDAFEIACHDLREMGIDVRSPHHEDLALGFDPDKTMEEQGFDINDCVQRDIKAILETEAIIMLKGWANSAGAIAEYHVAGWLNHPAYQWMDKEKRLVELNTITKIELLPGTKKENILEEANRLVHGARQASYGHPKNDFARTGIIWGAIIPDHKQGEPIEPRHVGMCMVGTKISRECNAHKRDNTVDMAGYAATLEMLHE